MFAADERILGQLAQKKVVIPKTLRRVIRKLWIIGTCIQTAKDFCFSSSTRNKSNGNEKVLPSNKKAAFFPTHLIRGGFYLSNLNVCVCVWMFDKHGINVHPLQNNNEKNNNTRNCKTNFNFKTHAFPSRLWLFASLCVFFCFRHFH